MTTLKRPGSSRSSGNVSAAQRLSAERRRCPECGRKSALIAHKNLPDDVISACRFCAFARMKDDGWSEATGWTS